MIPNLLVDGAFRETADGRRYIDLSTYVAGRGFTELRLTEGHSLGFDVAQRFLTSDDPSFVSRLSPADAQILRLFGLLLAPDEQLGPVVAADAAPTDDSFARRGVAVLPRLLLPTMVQALTDHYRNAVAVGAFVRGDRQANRHCAHNEPAGRVALNALRAVIEQIVGHPIKSSYAYVSLYCGGTDLPMHTDRPQCRYTLSLQLGHQPTPPDGRSPWPVQLQLDPNGPPVDCFQTIGGGILFRGCDIPHGRPTLAPGQESWVLLLHYVDIDFDGPLD